ncbi:hypothetical protein AOLI_G00114300 [Acnodon oligacanthus]
MSQRDTLVHLFAGGCGGTVGAILTCPLEVVKTRLQSSSVTLYISEVQLSTVNGASVARMSPPGPLHCLKLILEREGPRSLFRGLGPNLVGVAPSRAIYFAAYSTAKEKLNAVLEPDSTQVHMVSAGLAALHPARGSVSQPAPPPHICRLRPAAVRRSFAPPLVHCDHGDQSYLAHKDSTAAGCQKPWREAYECV